MALLKAVFWTVINWQILPGPSSQAGHRANGLVSRNKDAHVLILFVILSINIPESTGVTDAVGDRWANWSPCLSCSCSLPPSVDGEEDAQGEVWGCSALC